jgi:hypothetical protein
MCPIERYLGPPILACLSRPLEEDLFCEFKDRLDVPYTVLSLS